MVLQLLLPLAALVASQAVAMALPPLPTPQQSAYMDNGFSMFVHFGVNTFTKSVEHNDGSIPAKAFAPTRLDTDQWAATAKAMGAYAMCLTAKHEGGFALWPSKASNYTVVQSSVPTLDVVGEFVESCRKFGLQPCFYESPVENGHLMLQRPLPTTEQFVQQELAMYDELLGGSQYGHIERIWWDHYPYACGGLSSCPTGSFPASYNRIVEHVRKISPTTIISNGPDSQWVGNTRGVGAYPIWNYCSLDTEVSSKFCGEWSPDGPVYMPRMEGYSLQRSGHWFWHDTGLEQSLNASEIWGHWLRTVGRGTHWLLNVPPNTTGVIPEEYVKQLTTFGSALATTLDRPVAIVHNISAPCAPNSGFITLPLGTAAPVDMVQLREDMRAGQTVANYTLEAHSPTKGWVPLSPSSDPEVARAGGGVNGQTIGHRVVDIFPALEGGCDKLRWRCTAAGQQEGDSKVAHLASFSAHVRHPVLQ